MKYLSRIFFSGLAAVLPLTLTIYILYWLGQKAESSLGTLIKLIISEQHYWPGMGVISGVLLVFAVGLMLKAYLIRKVFSLSERLLTRVPLIKPLYTSIRDLMRFVSSSQDKELGQVVTITIPNSPFTLIGFVTNDQLIDISPVMTEQHVAVYLPLSYQIGGYTVLVPRELVKPANLSVNDALRFTVTAGMIPPENITRTR